MVRERKKQCPSPILFPTAKNKGYTANAVYPLFGGDEEDLNSEVRLCRPSCYLPAANKETSPSLSPHAKEKQTHRVCGVSVFGGDEEDRTLRPLHLRCLYSLTGIGKLARRPSSPQQKIRDTPQMRCIPYLVETKRIELSTLRMRTVRSPS